MPDSASSPATTDPDAVVRAFCDAWTRGDTDAILAAFTDDAVYHNIPMEPAVGIAAITEFIGGFGAMADSITFDIVHQVADGPIVMNERIDTIVMAGGAGTTALPVMGVFEVVDGKIAKWRDYFDMGQFSGS